MFVYRLWFFQKMKYKTSIINMETLKNLVKNRIQADFDQIVTMYEHLHSYPELSFHEKKTSEYICSKLDELGVAYKSGIGNSPEHGITGYGILAWIEGKNPKSRTIALRADMDALPIQEENDVPFSSKNDGVMHACGHDTHTTSLLSTLNIIHSFKDEIEGTVLFIFQPGEEKDPGGANLMLKDGLFDTFNPDIIIGQHAYVDYEVGTVGFQSGLVMASADEVHITVKGKGGHGAIPFELNDTVLAASQIIVAMQQVVSRRSNPFKPMVLSFGRFIADGATNIIPDKVVLAGSLRCMDEDERKKMKPIIKEIATNTAKAHGCVCDITINDGYPSVYNNPEVTEMMRSFAKEYLPHERVLGLPQRMTAEDFGFFSQKYPTTFYRFGIKGKQSCGNLHTSTFLIDDKSLKISVGILTYLTLRYCKMCF